MLLLLYKVFVVIDGIDEVSATPLLAVSSFDAVVVARFVVPVTESEDATMDVKEPAVAESVPVVETKVSAEDAPKAPLLLNCI